MAHEEQEHHHSHESEEARQEDTTTRTRPRTYFGTPMAQTLNRLSARIGLLGVPFDYGTMVPGLWTGGSEAPDKVRDAYTYSYHDPDTGEPAAGWYDVQADREYLKGVTMADCGNVAMIPNVDHPNLDRITGVVKEIAARDALVAAVGGDHAVSFPVGRGMERYEEVDVVLFDAHPDFDDERNGSRYTHGCQLRRLSELPFVKNISIIGLRNASGDVIADCRARDIRMVSARQLLEQGMAPVEEAIRPARHIYMSIDTDTLDHSLVPGTTAPEPAGIPMQLMRECIKEVCKKGSVVGMDVVEMISPRDFADNGARITSWLLLHALSTISASQE